ncbi:SCO family protein [Flavobacterium sp. UMI-01]|uniref:SCO family protein n=1 Tax=Flavobacterium sp. UMI-01 TaxID=1441053 RepID=UPI001C7DBE07|nr:SCO family protein [Flavobacterium sp. UMI-01]GIZ08845.1 SCO family protein [Flavobacterium sp. UMI-01]
MKLTTNFIVLSLIFCVFFSCDKSKKEEGLPFINSAEFTPEWISPDSPNYPEIHTIPPFNFTNQDGQSVTEKTVEGKIYVANFMFTSCGSICPKMTDNMKILQDKYSDDDAVILLSHSVMPETDNVAVLKQYAVEKGCLSGKWHLLTGNKDQIYSIAKRQYFAGDSIGYYGKLNDFLHTENFILVDGKRRIRGVYNGTLPIEMERIIEDITTLKKEN